MVKKAEEEMVKIEEMMDKTDEKMQNINWDLEKKRKIKQTPTIEERIQYLKLRSLG